MKTENYVTKNGEVRFIEFAEGKRWAIILDSKQGDCKIFELEKQARAYFGSLLNE